jgi:hypothetical protein
MKYDIHSNTTVEIKSENNENEVKEQSVRNNYRGFDKEQMKNKVNEIIDAIPENATGFYLDVSKNFDEQMDDALMREPY